MTARGTSLIRPRRSGKSAAFGASLDASAGALSPSPLDPFKVAYAVGMEAALREREEKYKTVAPEALKLKKASLLGCWVDGVLRFQSRDHDAIYGFAEDKMKPRTVVKGGKPYVTAANVWVAPVGSFIDAQGQK